jgi:penicillin-binding protein 2
MLNGFQGVTGNEKGTAFAAFQGFPLDQIPVWGKTGTAQVGTKEQGRGDTSLFAAFFTSPVDQHQYVVVAAVEEGGRGAQTAAPIVRRVIEQMTGVAPAAPVQSLATGRD